jgi:hypothetical protein
MVIHFSAENDYCYGIYIFFKYYFFLKAVALCRMASAGISGESDIFGLWLGQGLHSHLSDDETVAKRGTRGLAAGMRNAEVVFPSTIEFFTGFRYCR